MPTNPAVDLYGIESEVATDVVVGYQSLSCCCLEDAGIYVEDFACRGQVDQQDQASEVMSASYPGSVVHPPESGSSRP